MNIADPTHGQSNSIASAWVGSAVLVAIVVSAVVSVMVGSLFPDWRWESEPFHSVVEAAGALAIITLAVLLLVLREAGEPDERHTFMACGLIGMGILDICHACVGPGDAFVWLHSLAILAGGLFCGVVWLPARCAPVKTLRVLPVVTAAVAALVGIVSLAEPALVPVMVDNGTFTTPAKATNFCAGLGFLVAAGVYGTSLRKGRELDDAIFGGLCLLFAVAGFTFPMSGLWDAPWWLWHAFRSVACMVALCYVVVLYWRSQKSIELRTEKLSAANEELRQEVAKHNRTTDELGESKRRFRSLVESTSDWIWEVDEDGAYTYCSPKIEDLLGYQPEEVVGKTPYDFMPPNEAKRVAVSMGELFEARLPLVRFENVNLHKDGRHVILETSGVPILDEDGSFRGYRGIDRDITEFKRVEQSLREKQSELLAAQRIQEKLLPTTPPIVPGFDIAGALYPAGFAAGDYFDYLPMADGSIVVVIADVSGHGLGPSLLMASTQALLKSLTMTHTDLNQILGLANTILFNKTDEGGFVTLLLGRLDPLTGSFTYASAGHPTCYVLESSGEVKAHLESTSIPLAVQPTIDFCDLKTVSLKPGDLLFLVTDGVVEARSPENELYGKDRALDIVRAKRQSPASDIVQSLCAALRSFSLPETLQDDITAVVIKVNLAESKQA